MKRLLYIPLLIIALLCCKSNENDTVAAQDIVQSLVGQWRMMETEVTINGKKVWQPVASLTPIYLNFSPGGVMVDSSGKAFCCGAVEYTINGTLFKIDREILLKYYNDMCMSVSCFGCLRLDLEFSGNQLIVNGCQGSRNKYIKN